MRAVPLLLAVAALAPRPAAAGEHDFVVYIARLGGDTETAKPYIERFAAHLEKAMGWAKGSCKGAFFADRKEALRAIQRASPGFALLDPPLYFELRQAHALEPIAQLDGKSVVSARMHVVVKDPALSSLAALKGKKLWTTLADSPQYLSRVVLDGRLDAAAHFALKRVGTAGKAVRGVLRGEAQAALLDDDQLAAAKKMEGGGALRSLYSSPPLPPLPVVVFGKVLKAGERKKLAKTVTTMCSTREGAAVCKEMQLTRIAPLTPAVFAAAQKKYEAP
jgi:ABC-type phosphate/phosphonate transport system substrate-binding protein